ncbi:MAG: methylenetetrahydrofolate reductase [Acidimicrobiales bacterium]
MALIGDLLAEKRTVSFEFFPAKTPEARAQLDQTVVDLHVANPDFVSVTYGAGGSDRDRTRDVVLDIEQGNAFPAMAHLTCLGHTKPEIDALLESYSAGGVGNILALGGDPPADGSPVPDGDFEHAIDLVEYLRTKTTVSIGVAAHPEGHPRSPNLRSDRERLAQKLEVADFAVTQFFFDIDHYLSMVNDLADLGSTKPVVPGVIPITNAGQVARFAAMAGATIPAPLAARIEAVADRPDEVRKIGIEVAARLSQDLIEAGAPGIHFYTLNRSEASLEVIDQIDLAR